MPSKVDYRVAVAIALLAGAAVVGRLLPHAPNLALLGTLAFVSGRYWPRAASLITLIIVIVSDWLVGFYDWPVMISVWFCYLLTATLGRLAVHQPLRPLAWRPTLTVVSLTVIGSILFFIITNAAVWAAGWYPLTLAGLMQSLINGLPFARNTLVSDLSYTVISIAIIEGMMAARSSRVSSAIFVSKTSR